MTQAVAGGIEHRGIVGMEHRLHRGDIGMPAERLHGAEYDALAADHPILLRAACAGAKPAAGGNENGGGAFRFRHGTQVTAGGKVRDGVGAQALSRVASKQECDSSQDSPPWGEWQILLHCTCKIERIV